MQEKIKDFFIEKKGAIIFTAILLLTILTVFIALNSAASNVDDEECLVHGPGCDGDHEDTDVEPGDEDEEKPPVEPKASMPILGEYQIVRIFFDRSLPLEQRLEAVINRGDQLVNSTGLSFANADHDFFDVNAMLPGEVVDVIEGNTLKGHTVVIKHSDNIFSKYSALSEVNVQVGDIVEQGEVVGKSGTSINDNEAGNHVHLEVTVDDKYVNPENIFGKTVAEIYQEK